MYKGGIATKLKDKLTLPPLKYNALMPQVAIENLKLIEVDDLISLIGKDIDAIRCALEASPYGSHLSALPRQEVNAASLEEMILQNCIDTYKKLIKYSLRDVRSLLFAFLKKFEVANIKILLRCVKAKIDTVTALKFIIPVDVLDRNRSKTILAQSQSISDVINALSDVNYGAILKDALRRNNASEDLLQLEIALDKAIYQEIWESAKNLSRVDKKIAMNIIGIELDTINLKIILKCKALAVSENLINEYFMPTALFDQAILDKATKATSTKEILHLFLSAAEGGHIIYKNILNQMLKEHDAPLSRFEAIIDKAPLIMSLYMLKEHTRYFNIGFALAFLNLKWIEIRNLMCIINGTVRKLAPIQIRKLLILPNEL
ncbi:MAG: V-type ATPase subunit [Candidatus Jordarchaeaceae archaeon]